MINEVFTGLTRAIEGEPAVAMAAAVAWGVLSIVLSPCHLASLPLIVGFISGQGRMSTRRAFAISLLFSLGILVTIGAIGAVTAAAGRMLGDVGRWGNYAVAALFLAVGLHLLEVVALPLPSAAQPGIRGKGLMAALLLGLVFGVALGPCTFAYMAPVLGVAFRLAAADPSFAVLLLALYGVGHCGVIALAGTFAGAVQGYLDWNERTRGATRMKQVCGVLLLVAGLYLVSVARG